MTFYIITMEGNLILVYCNNVDSLMSALNQYDTNE
jgi:hypothetical protein